MTGHIHRGEAEQARVRLVATTIRALGLRRRDLAAYVGMTEAALNQYLIPRGQARMSEDTAAAILTKAGELARARAAIASAAAVR